MKLILLTIVVLLSAVPEKINSQWIQTKGPGAGKTDALITVNDIMLAGNLTWGGSDGRVYRSTDLGNEWVPADFGMVGGINNAMPIYDFDNIGTVIFAANGASGVHRTFDYGNNWERVNSGLIGSPLSLLSKEGLIFVGMSGIGVYVSTNLGLTWLARNNGLPEGTVIVYEMEKLGNYIYAGLEGGGGPAPLYRSSNNGLFWEISNNGLPLGSNVHEFTVNGNTLFTSIEGDFGAPEYGMFKSTDFGNTWTAANNGIVPYVVGGNAGEIFAHEGNVYLGTTYPAGERMFKSTNNGELWFPITNEIGNQQPRSFTATQNYIFTGLGQYRSVFRTSNGGASWEAANRGLTESWSRSLMYFNGVLYGGEFEGLFYTTDMGDHWTEMRNGLPFGLPVTDIENDGINIFVTTEQYGVFRSTDTGASWTENNSGITGTYSKYVEALQVKGNDLFIATWDGVFKSTNKGNSWTNASSGLPGELSGSVVKVNCITSLNGNLFIGTTLEKVFKSTNNGASWFFSGAGIGTYGSTVRDITVKGSTLFITTDGGIYKSTNEGASWTLLTAEGLTSKIITIGNNLLVSCYGYTVLTGYNLILSTNDGASWTTFNEGLREDARVMAMLVVGNTLFGGTDTRSVWKRDVSSLLPSMTLNLTLAIQGFYNFAANTMTPDTITVYLRNASAPYAVIDSAKAKSTITGNTTLSFTNAANGIPYYIHVKHRNSIETWSKSGGEVFTSGVLNYNFTTNPSMAFGNNQIQVDATPVKYAIYSGDVNQDDIIDGGDLGLADNDAFNFMSGYLSTDVNGDNIIDASDLLIIDNNALNFIGLIRP